MCGEFFSSTVCYLQMDQRVLMIRFKEKWNRRFCPPGGKTMSGETPRECVIREFIEETGLTLIHPRLKGLVYWYDAERELEGYMFVYHCSEYLGELLNESPEGVLQWVPLEQLAGLNLFPVNAIFHPVLFDEGVEFFEGKFYIDADSNVQRYQLVVSP